MNEAAQNSGGRISREAKLHDELLLIQDPPDMTVHSRLNQGAVAPGAMTSLDEEEFHRAMDRYPMRTMNTVKQLHFQELRDNGVPWSRSEAQLLREMEGELLEWRRYMRRSRSLSNERVKLTAEQKSDMRMFELKELRWTVELAAIANWQHLTGLDRLAEENKELREQGLDTVAVARTALYTVDFAFEDEDAHREDYLNGCVDEQPISAWYKLYTSLWLDMSVLLECAMERPEELLDISDGGLIAYELQYRYAKEALDHYLPPPERSIPARICRAIVKRFENKRDFHDWFREVHNAQGFKLIKKASAQEAFARARTQLWLFYLREVSDLSYSAMAEGARMSKTTVTRFMLTPSPPYEPRMTTVNRITDAALANLKRSDQDTVLGHMETLFNYEPKSYGELGVSPRKGEEHDADAELILTSQLEDLVEACDDAYLNLAHQRYEAFREGREETFVALGGAGRDTVVPVSGVEGKITAGSAAVLNTAASAASLQSTSGIVEFSKRAREDVKNSSFQTINIKGEVEAGKFVSALEWTPDDWIEMRLPKGLYGLDSFALRVRGDSMDKVFADGSILICKPYDEHNQPLPIDSHVIAIDPRSGDVEATCKKLVRDKNGSLVLRPESNNPEHKPIGLLALEDDEDNVFIQAVVVGAFQVFPG